jgi:outer membrane protein OmpA-like peptidoglycan-associated protein
MASGGTWSVYRNYSFGSGSDAILTADQSKAGEIASYAAQNPSYRIGIDGSNARRVSNVRTALVNAGVAPNRIQTGSLGSPETRTDSRVAVLVSN